MFGTALIASLALVPAPALGATVVDSTRWIVDNHGRQAGELTAVRRGDSVIVRFVYRDRNRGTRVETRYRLAPDGSAIAGEARPVQDDGTVGDVAERFEIVGDSVVFLGARARREPGGWTGLRTATPWEQASLARYLMSRPGRAAPVSGTAPARAEIVADTVLRLAGKRLLARFVMVYRGASATPSGVWLDGRGELLATDAQWFITARQGVFPFLPAMRAIERRWRNRQGETVASRVRTPLDGPLVITGADVFDSETGVVRARQTVVIVGERIARVGDVDAVTIPAGATMIDGTGKMVLPGMWDMHTHLQLTNQSNGSLQQLAQGITTVRDLGSDIDVAVSQRDRERAGRLASPRVILGGFIEAPLAWAGPSGSMATNEREARDWVARYDSLGYKQIKLYNVIHPDLVPTIAAEAKTRGMILSGHIPRGMSIRAAVSLGYDEVQHAAFLFSDFFPDSLFLPEMRAYSAVATAVAPTFDVDSPGMQSLIRFLAEHKTVIDGTFNIWIGGGASIVGAGGSTDQQRADSAYLLLIRRVYEAGVPLVAGTDNSTGVTYRRELEMLARGGVPIPKVLQIATIDAARFMRDDRDYGSVSVGKVADLILVDGKPTVQLSDLARVELVVRGGRLYKVQDLVGALNTTAQ